jgi:hypothetical protein
MAQSLEQWFKKKKKKIILNSLTVFLLFKFAFALHLMKNILGITNELLLALQKKIEDIVNAMTLVKMFKQRLQTMRDDE